LAGHIFILYEMKYSDNLIFGLAIAVVVIGTIVFYAGESLGENAQRAQHTTISAKEDGLVSSKSETSTRVSTTVESTTVSIVPTTEKLAQTTESTSTTSTTAAVPGTYKQTTSTQPMPTSTTINANFAKFTGRGLHQAFLDIQFFCPSCVPAVVASLSREPGVMSKSINYRQKVSYIIYNPEIVPLERVVELAAASGGASLINDTVI
jgi:copper chaperone CopZ